MGIIVTAKHKWHLNNICSSLLLLQINSQHAIQRKILFEKKNKTLKKKQPTINIPTPVIKFNKICTKCMVI